MARVKHSAERRLPVVSRSQASPVAYRRPLANRGHRDLGRPRPLNDLLVRRPPYLEGAVTAAVFIFLLYVILGGA